MVPKFQTAMETELNFQLPQETSKTIVPKNRDCTKPIKIVKSKQRECVLNKQKSYVINLDKNQVEEKFDKFVA